MSPSKTLRYYLQSTLDLISPRLLHHIRQRRWRSQWQRKDYCPAWRLPEMPTEVREAVDSGWFTPGRPILDVGCGSGELASWLAAEGYPVDGFDIAEEAIAKARRNFGHLSPQVTFQVGDILEAWPGATLYHNLLDRGCLNGLSPNLVPTYARRAAEKAAAGAHFLIVYSLSSHPIIEQKTWQELRAAKAAVLEAAFRPYFEIERLEDGRMSYWPKGRERGWVPSLGIWLVRQGQET
ncbi:MAG: class I SAM-dependent methyltransferase [Chloroflexota bacterium]